MRGSLSDVRTGLLCTIAAGLASAVILGSEYCGTREHISLSQIRDSPSLEGQVPVFISPRNRVAQLYSQALGSLFVASYDSQGYGGGYRTRLHEGLTSIEAETEAEAYCWQPAGTLTPGIGPCWNPWSYICSLSRPLSLFPFVDPSY
jgi:hypothetical protein